LKLRQYLFASDPLLNTLAHPEPNSKPLKLIDLPLEYRSILAGTNELYKAIEMSSGLDQTMFMYTVFNIMDNVLNYPYSDD
jgi:hypothetical protein